MKTPMITLLALIPIISFAQNHQGMTEADMQKMMQQMQKMESCMQKVDQTKLKVIEQRSIQFEAETKSLCASGKRAEAQAKAISFEKEMKKDPTLQAMNKCSEMMKGKIPEMLQMSLADQKEDRAQDHVCD